MSRCPGSDRNVDQKSNFEGLRAMSRLSRLWLKFSPKARLWRPAGHVTLSRLWLKSVPKVKFWRLAGHVTLSRLWLKALHTLWLSSEYSPKVKLRRPAGHVTFSRFWLKSPPNFKLWRPAGHVTLSRLWLKSDPKVKLCRPGGNLTSWSPWLKPCANVNLHRLWGKLCSKAGLSSLTPVISVIPVNENSSSSTLCPWAKRQAACKWMGMYVADTCARWPPSPCCCKLLCSTSLEVWDTTNWRPGLDGTLSKIICHNSRPSMESATFNVKMHSPLMLSTSTSISPSPTALLAPSLPSMRRRLFCSMGATRSGRADRWRSSQWWYHCHEWVQNSYGIQRTRSELLCFHDVFAS